MKGERRRHFLRFCFFDRQTLSNCLHLCYNSVMATKKLFGKVTIHYGKVSLIMLVVFAVLLAADLLLKHFEEAYEWQFTVIRGFIWVESGFRNSGAAFSFLSDEEWGRIFLVVFSFIMFFAVAIIFLFVPEKMKVAKLALAMIAAGALGNLVDRIALGEVRDFVWVNMLFSTACCNFADFWIVFGVIILIADMLFFNEYSVLPLTRSAREAQRARAESEAEDAARDDGAQAGKTGSSAADGAQEDRDSREITPGQSCGGYCEKDARQGKTEQDGGTEEK